MGCTVEKWLLLLAALPGPLSGPGACAQTGRPQFSLLTRGHLPFERARSATLAVGDLNRDGSLDVVVGRNESPVLVLLNDGEARFTAIANPALAGTGTKPTGAALGDVDGDGDLDLLAWVSGDRNLLFLNDGTGTFADASGGRIPAYSESTAKAILSDLDGDGDLDILAANQSSAEKARIHLNDGKGYFTDAPAGSVPAAMAGLQEALVADVDGDGDGDILCSGQGTRLYLNAGKGAFADASATHLPTSLPACGAMAAGDVDGDGDPDLLLGTAKEEILLLNDGAGRFAHAPAGSLPPLLEETADLVLADLDGDGDLDLFCANAGDRYTGQCHLNRICLNDGKGAFADGTSGRLPMVEEYSLAAWAADLDGDGDLDLLVANSRLQGKGIDRLYINRGGGRFVDGTAPPLPFPYAATGLAAAGDVDGDGAADLVACTAAGTQPAFGLFRGTGGGSFQEDASPPLAAPRGDLRSLLLRDLDADGDLDLAAANYAGQNLLFLNDGRGGFREAAGGRFPSASCRTVDLAAGDLDGDGDPDLLIGNDGEQCQLYLNDGRGYFLEATFTNLPYISFRAASLALGDLDGDGDLDAAIAGDGQNRLWRNDGQARFADITATHMPAGQAGQSDLALGDLDRDGDLDMVLSSGAANAGGTLRLFLNDGSGHFHEPLPCPLPLITVPSHEVMVGECDEDGYADVVACTEAGPRFFRNDGRGGFRDASECFPPGPFLKKGFLFDLDGDGDLDLAGGGECHFNLARQTYVPCVPRRGMPFRLELYGAAGNTALVLMSGRRARIELRPLGVLAVDLAVGFLLPPAAMGPQGRAECALPVPLDPSLLGSLVYSQCLALDPVSLMKSRFTNAVGERIW